MVASSYGLQGERSRPCTSLGNFKLGLVLLECYSLWVFSVAQRSIDKPSDESTINQQPRAFHANYLYFAIKGCTELDFFSLQDLKKKPFLPFVSKYQISGGGCVYQYNKIHNTNNNNACT